MLVLSPTADFDPARLPPGWSRRGGANAAISAGMEGGRPVLSFDAPGGDSLARALDQPLSAAPVLTWWWKLERDAFGGGPGDGLRRGLRIVVGFDGGGPTDLIQPSRWMREDAGFAPHHRRIEIAFGRIKDWRRIATRYDRCATNFFGAITLAAIVIFWLDQ